MKPILITGDRWTPIARRSRRQRCVIETDKPIVIKDSQQGSRERLLVPGKHLISFIYTLFAKPPEHNNFD